MYNTSYHIVFAVNYMEVKTGYWWNTLLERAPMRTYCTVTSLFYHTNSASCNYRPTCSTSSGFLWEAQNLENKVGFWVKRDSNWMKKKQMHALRRQESATHPRPPKQTPCTTTRQTNLPTGTLFQCTFNSHTDWGDCVSEWNGIDRYSGDWLTLSLAHWIQCSMVAGKDLRVQKGTSLSGGSCWRHKQTNKQTHKQTNKQTSTCNDPCTYTCMYIICTDSPVPD